MNKRKNKSVIINNYIIRPTRAERLKKLSDILLDGSDYTCQNDIINKYTSLYGSKDKEIDIQQSTLSSDLKVLNVKKINGLYKMNTSNIPQELSTNERNLITTIEDYVKNISVIDESKKCLSIIITDKSATFCRLIMNQFSFKKRKPMILFCLNGIYSVLLICNSKDDADVVKNYIKTYKKS